MSTKDRIVQRFLRARATRSVSFKDVQECWEDMLELETFATAVLRVARQSATKKFHDDRAFIGSIKTRGFPRSDRLLFDTKLVAAHTKGLLRLTRADLVQAMDPQDVAESEVHYQSAEFHFVALD